MQEKSREKIRTMKWWNLFYLITKLRVSILLYFVILTSVKMRFIFLLKREVHLWNSLFHQCLRICSFGWSKIWSFLRNTRNNLGHVCCEESLAILSGLWVKELRLLLQYRQKKIHIILVFWVTYQDLRWVWRPRIHVNYNCNMKDFWGNKYLWGL